MTALVITPAERRALIARRHRLDGSASTPEEVADAVLGLHATEPTSVVLSVLARSRTTRPEDVGAALYERGTLVKWLGMRRTLFVLPRQTVPVVQAAVSDRIAATLRAQLVARLERNGSVPPIDRPAPEWVASVEDAAVALVEAEGGATGARLGAREPRLRTLILARTASERPANVTSFLLTLAGAEGRIVRGSAGASWVSRGQRWEPVEHWFPGGLPRPDAAAARAELAAAYLAAFAPASLADLQWWTGWTKGMTVAALAGLDAVEVDAGGPDPLLMPAADLAATIEAVEALRAERMPRVALLPTLDPTPMGWQRRDWLLADGIAERGAVVTGLADTRGNLGPTLWWDDEIVGGWGVTPGGEVRTVLLVDRGEEARRATDAAAAALQARFDGVAPIPALRTTLERTLSAGGMP